MKKLILLLLICNCFFAFVEAQGTVRESVDPKVAQLMKRFTELNKSNKEMKGWRIQILATTDRQKMENALIQFRSLYPNIPADWVHAKPYYKVQVGAFTSKRDAQATMYLLKRDYHAVFPVPVNDIKPEELLR